MDIIQRIDNHIASNPMAKTLLPEARAIIADLQAKLSQRNTQIADLKCRLEKAESKLNDFIDDNDLQYCYSQWSAK